MCISLDPRRTTGQFFHKDERVVEKLGFKITPNDTHHLILRGVFSPGSAFVEQVQSPFAASSLWLL